MSNETFHGHLRMEVEWGTIMDKCDRMEKSGTSSMTVKCAKCNLLYMNWETLAVHVREVHEESEEARCVCCTTGEQHPILYTYTCEFKPYKCQICRYSTGSKGNLKIHMKSDKHLNNIKHTIGALTPTEVCRDKLTKTNT